MPLFEVGIFHISYLLCGQPFAILILVDIFFLGCLNAYITIFNQKFLEHDFLMENLSRDTPAYVVTEGSEPPFFTRFFNWDSAKSAVSIPFVWMKFCASSSVPF